MSRYRPRAVSAIKGLRKLKPHNPVVNFGWTRTYQVGAGTTPVGQNNYIMELNAATPFSPFQPRNGDWVPTDNTAFQPLGLNSDMYTHYKYLVVKGCHITASVVDNLDATNIAEDEKICLGQLSIVRSSENTSVSSTDTAIDLKNMYGNKSRDFTLASRTLGVDGLSKSAKCSNGYSAKKQWNASANALDDLRVINTSGSANTPNDSTYLNVCIVPRFDTNSFLQPLVVSLKVSYIIQFQDATITQTVPLPMGAGNKYKKRKNWNKKQTRSSLYNNAKLAGIAAAAAGIITNRRRVNRIMY